MCEILGNNKELLTYDNLNRIVREMSSNLNKGNLDSAAEVSISDYTLGIMQTKNSKRRYFIERN